MKSSVATAVQTPTVPARRGRAGPSKSQFVQSEPPLRQGSYRSLAAVTNNFAVGWAVFGGKKSPAAGGDQALMDIGATVCTARKPLCDDCPVQQNCKSKALGSYVHFKPNGSQKLTYEPAHRGIPRRIWRGKIIQILRRLPNRRSMSVTSLSKTMRLQNNDARWVSAVVHQLEKDGVGSTSKRSSETFVSLAA